MLGVKLNDVTAAPVDNNSPTLVFLHGWASDARIWRSVCEQLHCNYVVWDLPGFGQNQSELQPNLEVFLEQAINALPMKCILVGWSLGGMLATRLAYLAPEKVLGLITFAANPVFVANKHWQCAMPRAMFAQFLNNFNQSPNKTFARFCLLQTKNDARAKHLVNELKLFSPKPTQVSQWSIALEWLGNMDNRAIISELGIPQLHVYAGHDELVPAQVAAIIKESQHIQLRVLPGACHCLPLSEATQCAALIQQFLQSWQGISKQKIAQSFSLAAKNYDQSAKIQQTVGNKILGLIDYPLKGVWLDLGSGTGFLQRNLPATLRPAQWINGDLALGMLNQAKPRCEFEGTHWLNLDAEHLPFAPQSLDGIISSLTLQWVNQLPIALANFYKILKPGGECIISTLVDGTLAELKSAWQAVDDFTHVNTFLTSAEVQTYFVQAGFGIQYCDEFNVVDEYAALLPLLKSLKAIGAHNMNRGQKPGLTTRRQLEQLAAAYDLNKTGHGTLPATYQVLIVRAKKYE